MGVSRNTTVWLVALFGLVAVGAYTAWIGYIYIFHSGLTKPVVDNAVRQGMTVDVSKVRQGVYLLRGAGGNITALVGDEGILIVDSGERWMADKIGAALKTLSDKPVRYVITTHSHGDHRGGNGYFRQRGAEIIAHANTAKNMVIDTYAPASPEDMPTVTFETEYQLALNGEDIRLSHLPNAHTDGDVIVRFTKENVLTTGDAFSFGSYPFLSVGGNGSIGGHLAGHQKILARVNDNTMIVPGHGPLARKVDLAETAQRLGRIRDYAAALKSAGVPVELAPVFYPTYAWRADWRKRPMTDMFFLGLVYKTLP